MPCIAAIATFERTAASHEQKTHCPVDLTGRVYDWSGATKTGQNSPKGECGGTHQYFRTLFASAEGKNGGQFDTPFCVVRLLVEMLAPYKGRIYDLRKDDDVRWQWSGATWTTEDCPEGERGGVHQFGVPPKVNANFAWVQHFIHHLAPHGSMALLLANGVMSSGSGAEGDIQPSSCSCG